MTPDTRDREHNEKLWEEAREAAITRRQALEPPADGLIAPAEAAALLGVSVVWLYRHARKFTFTRKLSRKMLRFHAAGLRAYIEKGRR